MQTLYPLDHLRVDYVFRCDLVGKISDLMMIKTNFLFNPLCFRSYVFLFRFESALFIIELVVFDTACIEKLVIKSFFAFVQNLSLLKFNP